MKGALNTLFWKVLSQERCKLSRFFPLHLFLPIIPTSFSSLTISHHLCHCIDVQLSLPQLVVRQCRQRMSQCWKGVRPRSPAACRTMTDQLWSSRIPAGRLFSSTAQEVCMQMNFETSHWRHITMDSLICTFHLLPFRQFHIEKLDNPRVNLVDGVILSCYSMTALTASVAKFEALCIIHC